MGVLHENMSFSPTGVYRLPFGETSVDQARLKIEEMWRDGLLGRYEYEAVSYTIAQVVAEMGDGKLGDESSSTLPGPE
jgi:hypothetical protein